MVRLVFSKKTVNRILNICIVVNLCCLGFFSLVLVQHYRYDKHNFNCVDMSKEIATVFSRLGFDTWMVYGYNRSLPVAHCWVKVNGLDFEATGLHFDSSLRSRYRTITEVRV